MQEWHSGESTYLPPTWPGFDSQTWHTIMWVEFVGSLQSTERFFSGYSSSFPFLLYIKGQCPWQVNNRTQSPWLRLLSQPWHTTEDKPQQPELHVLLFANCQCEGLGDGAYSLLSLSKTTRESIHLQTSLQRQHFLRTSFKTLRVGLAGVLMWWSTNWANRWRFWNNRNECSWAFKSSWIRDINHRPGQATLNNVRF